MECSITSDDVATTKDAFVVVYKIGCKVKHSSVMSQEMCSKFADHPNAIGIVPAMEYLTFYEMRRSDVSAAAGAAAGGAAAGGAATGGAATDGAAADDESAGAADDESDAVSYDTYISDDDDYTQTIKETIKEEVVIHKRYVSDLIPLKERITLLALIALGDRYR